MAAMATAITASTTDWCPAEEEDEDDKVLFKGRHAGRREECCQGRRRACARETALAARDLKRSPRRDITGGMNLKELLK